MRGPRQVQLAQRPRRHVPVHPNPPQQRLDRPKQPAKRPFIHQRRRQLATGQRAKGHVLGLRLGSYNRHIYRQRHFHVDVGLPVFVVVIERDLRLATGMPSRSSVR